jgi:hypothetical protein
MEAMTTEERKECRIERLEGLVGDPDEGAASDDGFDII